jgi:hypothetical protein
VIAELVRAGAPAPIAEELVATLMSCGLSATETKAWLFDPQLEYPIRLGRREVAGQWIERSAPPYICIETGRSALVLEAAREFAAASDDERRISRLLLVDLVDVRRLTANDPSRAAVIAAIVTVIEGQLRKPRRVSEAALRSPELYDGRRLVDRIIAGQERALLDELRGGAIDLVALSESGMLSPLW